MKTWHKYDCQQCKKDVSKIQNVPKRGLIVSSVIYSTVEIKMGICGHYLDGQMSLFDKVKEG